jgi:hypothetical protein
MPTLIDCADTLNCATLSGSNNVNVAFQAGVPNKIVVSLTQSVVGLSKLEVTGNAIISDNSSNAALRITQTGVGEAIRVEDSANPDSTPFVITSDGNVGIGTATPSAELDVQGYTSYRGNAYTIASFAANNTLAPLNIVQSIDGTNPSISAGKNSAGTYGSLQMVTSESVRVTVLNNGNVGIGTAAPEQELHIENNGFTNEIIRSAGANGAAGSYLIFQRSSGTISSKTALVNGSYVGGISFAGYDGTSSITLADIQGIVNGTPGANDMPGALAFSTTADGASSVTERMRIDAAGNVGIGTSSPNGVLTVQENTGAATWVINAKTNGINNDSGIYANSSNDMEFAARNGSAVLTTRIGSTGDSYISSSDNGNVGIGTKTPTAKLEIIGGSTNDTTPEFRISGSNGKIDFYNSLDNNNYNGIVETGDKAIIFTEGPQDTGNFVIAPWISTGTKGIRITSNGDVGIGVSTPSTKLHVNGNITADGIVFGSTGGSVTSKTLEDYEEGTWTPTLTSSVGATLSSVIGSYIKIGKTVHAYASFNITSFNAGAGALTMKGLPFTSNSSMEGFAQNYYYYSSTMSVSSSLGIITLSTAPHGYVPTSTTTVTLLKNGGTNGDTPLLAADLTAAAFPNAIMKWYITYISST